MEIIDCDQNSDEWLRARLGMPTSSMFSTIMAKGKGNAPSKTRRTYMMKLLGERLTGEPADNFTNAHMERGHEMEPEARDTYAFMHDVEPQLVGFVRNGDKGASPDSLIGAPGLLEIKTKLPHILLPVLLSDEVPPEHTAQIQGQIWVCEREWCDFCAYWPGLPLFVKRVYRDDTYIQTLSEAVHQFNDELNELEIQVRQRYAA